ncbi:MAG: hypothetical protein OXN89_00270 [Bryobacterales bacterium]|nr:hypothetical protein [Bryobacterales bacterium]
MYRRFPRHIPAVVCALALALGTPLIAQDITSVRVRFGLLDTVETHWDGSASVTGGDLVRVYDWRPRPENSVEESGAWRFSTRVGVNYNWRAYENLPDRPVEPYLWTPGVIVEVRGGDGARVRINTAQGEFEFAVADVNLAEPQAFLNGAAVVDLVPTVERLAGEGHEDDFVSVLGGPGGPVRVAWVAFQDGASDVFTRAMEGDGWGPIETVSEASGDIHIVQMGRAGDGTVWYVWAQQRNGNFDLYGRALREGSWNPTVRLTEEPQPDVLPRMATATDGTVWLVWQGFRDGQSDILLRRFVDGEWAPTQRVSSSDANDWEPDVVAGHDGEVHVGWDSYGEGNYDVMVRSWGGDRWDAGPQPVAGTPLYEAHVSLAVDGQNRLWAAWNESGLNWGKDTGFLLPVEGTLLYEYRLVRVAVKDGIEWHIPEGDINSSLAPHMDARHNDFPRLATDGDGRVWLFGRHRTIRQRDMPDDTPLHRAAWTIWGSTLDGGRWTLPYEIPNSYGRQDVRWGVVADEDGSLVAAWPSDGRDWEGFLYRHNDVYAARLPALGRGAAPPALRIRPERVVLFHDVAPTEARDLERVRGYEINSQGKTYRIYRGDTHRHTEFSMDGNNDGSLFQTYRYALDAASLDYLLVSEHNFSGGPDNPYINWVLQQVVDVFSVSGRFQPFYGYERSVRYPDGHRNILLPKRGTPTLPILPEESNHASGAGRLYEYLRGNGGIAISHTSATGMGTDWRDNDPEVEPLVEIFQGDRVSAEYEGAPLAAHRERPTMQAGGFQPAGYVWNAWAKGYKLGVQVASDHLSTHYSYACTIAEDFTREGLLDAMKQRHSYGATDNIVLDYRLEANGREYLQGDILKAEGPFRLTVKVLGTTRIRQVDIIKNQEFVYTRQILPQDIEFDFEDAEKAAGEDYYYVRVQQADGNVAWSSPIWVTTD